MSYHKLCNHKLQTPNRIQMSNRLYSNYMLQTIIDTDNIDHNSKKKQLSMYHSCQRVVKMYGSGGLSNCGMLYGVGYHRSHFNHTFHINSRQITMYKRNASAMLRHVLGQARD